MPDKMKNFLDDDLAYNGEHILWFNIREFKGEGVGPEWYEPGWNCQ